MYLITYILPNGKLLRKSFENKSRAEEFLDLCQHEPGWIFKEMTSVTYAIGI